MKRIIALAFILGLAWPRLSEAAAAPTPFQVVDGDGWLTSNARYDPNGWASLNGARPSFGLQLSARNDIPFDQGTAGAEIWVRQPGCPRFANFGEKCGWQLGLAVTQFRSVVVGGHGIEIDGLTGERPYGRVVSASSGESRLVGLTTNVFADFSGVDKADAPSWFAGIDLGRDAFSVRRGAKIPLNVDEVFGVDRQGDVRMTGSLATSRVVQRAPAQWATRAQLVHGAYTFRFAAPFQATPVCVATGEGSARLRVAPSSSACTITSENANDASMVDVIAVGNPG